MVCFCFFSRCLHIFVAGAPRRSQADTRGEVMAAEEPDAGPDGVAETYQPRGQRTELFGVSE